MMMVKSGMTQGKSEIVSRTNFGSKNKKLEPFLNRGRRPFHDWWPFPSFFPASQCVAAF